MAWHGTACCSVRSLHRQVHRPTLHTEEQRKMRCAALSGQVLTYALDMTYILRVQPGPPAVAAVYIGTNQVSTGFDAITIGVPVRH
jgi:hypothetical protein